MTARELRLRVEHRETIGRDVERFVLVPVERETTLPSYAPGSHLALRTPTAVNAYSLTDDGFAPDAYRIAVRRREPGGGSHWLHTAAGLGDVITAAVPRSAFPPVLSATRHLLLAAGIGITPILSHVRAAVRWNREFELVVGASAGEGLFADELDALAGDRLRRASGRASIAAEVERALGDQPVGTHAYACGPEGFLRLVAERARALGWPDARTHFERFDAPELDAGAGFAARLESSGRVVAVASGTSLLEALDTVGVRVDRMCERGVCGRCEVGVRHGDVVHRDLVLDARQRARGDRMMACVSRAAAGATLELDL